MKAHLASFAIASAFTLAIACGDSKPEPVTPATTPSAEPDATIPPAQTAMLDAGPPPVSSAAPTQTDTPSGTTVKQDPSGAVTVESKDECTPVGVDFEKRARPKVKECYAEGKKATKNPDLQGAVKIKVVVDMKGKIKSTTIVDKPTLPDSVAQCMLKAVKGTSFPEVDKCWDSTITIPIQFPTPR